MPRQSSDTPTPRADQAPAANLSESEQEAVRASVSADVSPRAPEPDLSGKRLRAIPAVITKSGDRGTTVEVRARDFEAKGIEHKTIRFDERRDNSTLAVGDKDGQISEEAADFLAKNYPTSFEYINQG